LAESHDSDRVENLLAGGNGYLNPIHSKNLDTLQHQGCPACNPPFAT
jgi:hypothetical protein